jgi:two-component system response regulator PilR (NtrC family)
MVIGMGIRALPLPAFLQQYSRLSNLRSLWSRKKKALVVDDEPDARKVLVLHLTRHGYECEEVGNAFAAMSWFEHNHADLVTTDIHQGWCMEDEGKWMPRPTGIELVEYLAKRSGPKPPIMIVVSGNMDYSPTYSERARKAGAKGVFSKPLDKKEFLALIESTESRTGNS